MMAKYNFNLSNRFRWKSKIIWSLHIQRRKGRHLNRENNEFFTMWPCVSHNRISPASSRRTPYMSANVLYGWKRRQGISMIFTVSNRCFIVANMYKGIIMNLQKMLCRENKQIRSFIYGIKRMSTLWLKKEILISDKFLIFILMETFHMKHERWLDMKVGIYKSTEKQFLQDD
jgi:hypothetical protein